MLRATSCTAIVLLACSLVACGQDGVSTNVDAVLSQTEAFQFLNQTSFGATPATATQLIELNRLRWIEEQINQPASLQLPFLQALAPTGGNLHLQPDRVDIWLRNVINGPDQLRQRVAFALSQIMVVSQLGALQNAPFALASYYDLLTVNAFGNFRDLLKQVTLHPAMGVYLSMLGNAKPDPKRAIRPDENYARELLQLFTVGLVELELDGSVRKDAQGQPIPTFNQATVEAFARIFTGWTYQGAPSFSKARITSENQIIPMQAYADFHDTDAKQLLNGVTVPAGQTPQQDLDAALDNIFMHPNVAPFISIQLIKRLVTSNPSAAYVRRVATVFVDNGHGVRGDLQAVVQAILLDPEARVPKVADQAGKLKEPIIKLIQFWRTYHARSASGKYTLNAATETVGQGPLQAPSVFNFYLPHYSPPGELDALGLSAPEMQITTEYLNANMTNFFRTQIFSHNSTAIAVNPDDIRIDISEEINLAANAAALVDFVAAKLLGNPLPPTLRTTLLSMIENLDAHDATARAAYTIYLISTSPLFAVQY